MEHFIRTYDDVLTADLCADAISRFEASPNRFDGLVNSADGSPETRSDHKQTTELFISNDPAWRDIEDVLKREYIEYTNRYAQEFSEIRNIPGELSSEPFRIKKYDIGGFFSWHIDCGGTDFNRLLAVQFYFNDVEEGGETEFEYQSVSVKSVRGRLAIFPTLWTYRHRGAEVVSNPKYVCTNYVRINSKT